MREMLEAEDADPARSLVRIAREAEARDDLDLAADCWGKLAGFAYPKPRPTVIDPDALVELEARIAAARLQAQADVVAESPGLADRLMRVMAQLDDMPTVLQPVTVINAAPQPASRDPEPVEEETSAPTAGPAFPPVTNPDPMPIADAAIIAAQPSYTPMLAPWPERQVFADGLNYSPLSDD